MPTKKPKVTKATSPEQLNYLWQKFLLFTDASEKKIKILKARVEKLEKDLKVKNAYKKIKDLK